MSIASRRVTRRPIRISCNHDGRDEHRSGDLSVSRKQHDEHPHGDYLRAASAVFALMAVTYPALVELGTYLFFQRMQPPARPVAVTRPRHERRVHRVASAWTHAARLVHHREV